MKKLKLVYQLAFLFFIFFDLNAQPMGPETNESNEVIESSKSNSERNFGIEFKEALVQDGAYEKIAQKERIALPYDHLREADVLWSKRIWRVIDTQEKMNLPFRDKQQPFISCLLDLVQKNPEVRIFETDAFHNEINAADVESRLASVDSAEIYDFKLEDYVMQKTTNEFNPDDFSKFRIKEDWLFDEETSMMVCRIIGIAPIQDRYTDQDEYLGQEALFWIYYPDIRDHLAKYEAKNPYNDAIQMSWHKVFEDRYFSSHIMKESNPRNRRIEDYATGHDALKEGERIQGEILDKEIDLWSY